MPTDVFGIPLLPLMALIGGILILIKADLLNWVIAIFLIGFGVLGILPAIGIDIGVTNEDVQRIVEEPAAE
ncbi:MAG: DUF3096 domain-containing protein [Paracoccaceae bacterium]